jgi:hypothetical protein
VSLTLVEAAKLAANDGETKRAGVIAMFAKESQWLASLIWKAIQGNAYAYNREGTLPSVAFRGVNESYTESTGIINPLVEALRIAGGDLDVDMAILKTQGESVRAVHEQMKVKSLAAEMTRVLIKGDSTSQPREFDGLQNRITGAQLVENGVSSGGDVLSLSALDAAIDQCVNPTAIWLPKAMKRRITQASRNTTVGGFITLLTAYPDNGGTEPIAYTEVGSGGGTAQSASLYVLGIGDGLVSGITNGGIEVRDLGEVQTAPVKRTRVEWLAGLCIEHGRAAVRLRGIKDGAVVA